MLGPDLNFFKCSGSNEGLKETTIDPVSAAKYSSFNVIGISGGNPLMNTKMLSVELNNSEKFHSGEQMQTK